MGRVRLHIPLERWGTEVPLEPKERQHLVDVLRLGAGDGLEVFDGQGGVCPAELVQRDGQWSVALGPLVKRDRPRPRVRLAIALLKGRKLDDVIRMVTEVGVAEVAPFACQRSVPRPDARRLGRRIERWRAIAVQAARQAGRTRVPKITGMCGFSDLMGRCRSGLGLLLYERVQGTDLVARLACEPSADRLVVVGPEGGFSAAEVAMAEESGFAIVGLGLPVLRSQTAAVVAAALACIPDLDAGRNPDQGA